MRGEKQNTNKKLFITTNFRLTTPKYPKPMVKKIFQTLTQWLHLPSPAQTLGIAATYLAHRAQAWPAGEAAPVSETG